MYKISKIPGRNFLVEDKEMLWFGGTSYLGIPHVAQFQELVKYGLDNIGGNWGSSRNNPLQLSVYENVELFLAKFANAPAALTVSSGMLAGQIVMNYLNNCEPSQKIIYSPRVHPTLWGNDYIANNESFIYFVDNINNVIESQNSNTITIVADAVSSPHIELYNFDWIANLPENKTINIVIDDSHSIGVMGANGRGIFDSITAKNNVNLFVVASLNKALGVLGGVIFGKNEHLLHIRNMPYFAGCSPMSPAYAYACSEAEIIYSNQLEILKQNCRYFNEKIRGKIEYINLENHPAYCFPALGLAEFLLTKNILIPNFAYPNPNDPKVTRLVISSLHTINDLDYLSDCLYKFHKI
jgi:8-amino-7-oxononanoate synthase